MTNDRIREIFLANGFTVKPGQADLKPYVYAAARALINATLGEAAVKCDQLIEPSVDLNDTEYCDWQIGTQDCAKEIRGMKHDQD